MTPTVHVLAYGRALCGSVHGIPAGWGPGHRWVSAFDESWRENATCETCRVGATRLAILRREESLPAPADEGEE